MIKELTLSLLEAIKTNGARSIFWAGIIEQVISPIPSVLIPMGGGALLIAKNLPLGLALIQIGKIISFPYALAVTVGSSVLYLGSFYGGKVLIEKFGKFFALSPKSIERFKNRFTRGFKDELLIFLLVALPVTPISLIAASCGVIGIGPLEFYPLVFLGTLVRATFLGWLGWQAGGAYQLISSGLNVVETLLTLAGAGTGFLILAFLYWRRQRILRE